MVIGFDHSTAASGSEAVGFLFFGLPGLLCFFAACNFRIFCFSIETGAASLITAPLAEKAIFAIMLLRASLVRHVKFANYARDSNERHFCSDL
jgi:hypothetical protein